MKKPYFIMMYNQKGDIAMPIVEGQDEEVKFFETKTAARKLADDHYFAPKFGYEIFSMDEGL